MLLNIRSGDVPVLLRKTAEEVAGAFFDMNRSDKFRMYAGTQRTFVRQCWKDHLPIAIDLLSALLAEPGRDEREKEEIYDALVAFNNRASERTPNLSLRSIQ